MAHVFMLTIINTLVVVNLQSCIIIGEPCVNFSQPFNADVWCSGDEVTDEICGVTCDPGYTLSGSENRTCLSDHTWSGEEAVCLPMKCSQLEAPENALVVMPCNSDFKSSCTIICNNGYHVPNSSDATQWVQSCVLNDVNITVEWSQANSCIGKYNNNCSNCF